MRNKERLFRTVAFLLVGILWMIPAGTASAETKERIVYIRTVDEFLAFAEECTLDSAYHARMVVLETDISLEGTGLTQIPTFGGTFEGNGHTISGLSVTGAVSPAGLFGVIQETGIVRNLKVQGKVEPSGSRLLVGGIAGENFGRIWNCSFSGVVSGKEYVGGLTGRNQESGIIKFGAFSGMVTGETMVGGIVGCNNGSLNDCVNEGNVNAESSGAGNVNDIGGIVGYSVGMVLSCSNHGTVGYPHVGYNVGGIAGRSCGFISNAQNDGNVYGRKDIGGIVGQLEPDFIAGITEDWLGRLRAEVNELSRLVEVAVNDAEGTSDAVSGRLTMINNRMDVLVGEMDDLAGSMTGYADDVVAEVNRLSALASDAITRMKAISGQGIGVAERVSDGMAQMKAGFDEMREAVRLLSEFEIDLESVQGHVDGADKEFALAVGEMKLFVDDMERMMLDMDLAIDDMMRAATTASSAMSSISSGMSKLEAALIIRDQAAVDTAFEELVQGLRELAVACGEFAAASEELEVVLQELEEELSKQEAPEAESADDAGDDGESGDGATGDDGGTGDMPGWDDIFGETGQDYEELMASVEQIAQTMQILGDSAVKVAEPMRRMADAGGDMGEALQLIAQASAIIGENVSFDGEKAKQGMSQISSGVSLLGSSMDDLYYAMADVDNATKDMQAGLLRVEKAMGHLDEVKSELDGAKEALDAEAKEADQKIGEIYDQILYAMDCLAEAGDTLNLAGEEATKLLMAADELVTFLAEAETAQLAEPSEALDKNFAELSDAMDALLAETEALNLQVDGQTVVLAEDLRQINDQLNLVCNVFFDAVDAMENASGEDMVVDTSEEQMDATLFGRVYDCRNEGDVYGDTCVGGIAGAMATENELDPEDDMVTLDELTLETRYEQKALLQEVVNRGEIIAKKDYAGGICGRMNLGLVYHGENYGPVRSEGGDYVGGIAGLSDAKIRESYVKAALSGKNYVGGVLGSAVETAGDTTGSVVSNCYSMVAISGCTQYFGAVAGIEDGIFEGNYFVKGELAGINGRSLFGKAEPKNYEDFLTLGSLPEEFFGLTIRFVADGEVVYEITKAYGADLTEDEFPALPEKTGYWGSWDETELQRLTFDAEVTAVYTPLLSALASTIERDDGRPMFLVEGAFAQDSELEVKAQEVSADGFIMLARDLEETVLNYLRFLEDGTRPDESVNYKIEEQWSLRIPRDGKNTHIVRYLPENGETGGLDVYLKTADGWKKTETRTMGSYLLFEVEGEDAEILILSTLQVWWIWMIGAIAGLTIAAFGVKIVVVIRRRRKTKKIKEEAECLENE